MEAEEAPACKKGLRQKPRVTKRRDEDLRPYQQFHAGVPENGGGWRRPEVEATGCGPRQKNGRPALELVEMPPPVARSLRSRTSRHGRVQAYRSAAAPSIRLT